MAEWQYAFFFPPADRRLIYSEAIPALMACGYVFSNSLRYMVPIDNEGHFGEYGEEAVLDEPVENELRTRLENGEQIFVVITKEDVKANILISMSCAFVGASPNPHFYIAWPSRLFARMSEDAQRDHWSTIKMLAKATKASYVVIAVEASDTFEDRFLEIDGVRVLDLPTSYKFGRGRHRVWVDYALGGIRPMGVATTKGCDIGDGLVEFEV